MKVVFATFILLLISISIHAAQPWDLQKDDSAITFTASYDGVSFEGMFSDFEATLVFAPDDLRNSHVESAVNVSSVNTQSRDRDQVLSEPDWFYFKKFPQANFSSNNFHSIGDNEYIATGILQIRNKQHEVELPFKWIKIDNQTTQLRSQFMLDRRTYNIGIGEWKNDKTIGFDVVVNLELTFKLTN
ncbi:MAG: YceI family protein [Pseudomonadota bacterium]